MGQSDSSTTSPAAAPQAVTVRTAGPDELETIARVRARCYREKYSKQEQMLEYVKDDLEEIKAGDVLLADRGGQTVATTTSFRGEMNLRGAMLPCQGIAWVGTTHDSRRAGGVASTIMRRALDLAREREEPISSLMPFRASFYEHFGYGLVERQMVWQIPLTVLPQEKTAAEGWSFAEPGDETTLAAVAELRLQQVRANHGEMRFPHTGHRLGWFGGWLEDILEDGYLFVDRDTNGRVVNAVMLVRQTIDGKMSLEATMPLHTSGAGLRRILAFVGTMRDQYAHLRVRTGPDVPLHLMLEETQLPHRGVVHPHASAEMVARMQVRVLDSQRVLEAMIWPDERAAGEAVVAVHEPEGDVTKLRLSVEAGRCSAAPTEASPTWSTSAKTWASVLFGELPAGWAVSHGLAAGDASQPLLDTLAAGPKAFCREVF